MTMLLFHGFMEQIAISSNIDRGHPDRTPLTFDAAVTHKVPSNPRFCSLHGSKEIGFRSLSEGAIDTTCASGKLIFNIFTALAQFERRLIQERTEAGLAAARARGRIGGRPPISFTEPKVQLDKMLHQDKSINIDNMCKTLNISRSTYYRFVRMKPEPLDQ